MTASWDKNGRRAKGIRVGYADHFNARGMRRVYGRGDHYGGGKTYHMDVWLTRNGRLFARFWARRDEVDWLSWEIFGMPIKTPPNTKALELDEDWVPQCLRREYDNWIISEF